jgi:hypothetical protein
MQLRLEFSPPGNTLLNPFLSKETSTIIWRKTITQKGRTEDSLAIDPGSLNCQNREDFWSEVKIRFSTNTATLFSRVFSGEIL